MLRRAQLFRSALRYLTVAGSFLVGASITHADDMVEGMAVATSLRGSIHLTSSEEERSKPLLHDTVVLNAATIETGNKAHIFFALSNGMGIGIGENSIVTIETYLQRPFLPKKARLSYEPSVSRLSIHLTSGSLAIVSNKLSPLSEARVSLPTGELRIHSATCIVQNDELGAHITACDGTITYYYPDGEQREFIVEPQSIRISPQSAKLGQVTEGTTLDELPADIDRFAKATQYASKRVFFEASYDGKELRPVIISTPAYYNQADERPYVFND